MTPGITGSPLDREEPARHDPARLAELAADPAALLLPLTDYAPEVADERLGWVPLTRLPPGELALLGTIDGIPRFARLDPAAPAARRSPELFALLAQLRSDEAATYAAARSLLDWHARHRFCANCGSPTEPIRAGWARLCPACRTEHFPRTDPVVIMLGQNGTGEQARALVGRQPQFPPGSYSALAGFVEVGEALEEAVRRELKEEAGVVAGVVRFVASQPWPFPSQLMIACIAQVEDDALTIDYAELEDAKWVTRDEVRRALAGADDATFKTPPPFAIAYTLLQTWAESDPIPSSP